MKSYRPMNVFTISVLLLSIVLIPIKAITIGTYNVEHGDVSGLFTPKALFVKEGNWQNRKQGVCNIIKNMKADIYCFQEVIHDNGQFDDIKKDLSDYGYIGQPRSAYKEKLWHYLIMLVATDEHNPIFYNQTKIELLDSGTFGINANSSWHLQLLPRICTWAHFKEKATGKDFFTYNTHLDHASENNRIVQIKTILNDVKQRSDHKPVILMGDFNTTFTGDMETTLTDAGFTHARTVAKEADQYITTHVKGKPFEIDHILVKPKNAFDIKTYKVCGERGKETSDHNPICATFTFK